MTCAACGSVLGEDVRFCPRCGARIVSQAQVGPSYTGVPMILPYTRVGRNLQVLGMLWLIYAALRMFTGIAGLIFLHGFFGSHIGHGNLNFGWSPFHHLGLSGLWPIAFTSIFFSIGCAVLTGFALLTRQPWGRILAIVFGIFALIHFPLGTALGIYTLWVLAPSLSGNEYAGLAYAQHGA
jgi:hypothetical protein